MAEVLTLSKKTARKFYALTSVHEKVGESAMVDWVERLFIVQLNNPYCSAVCMETRECSQEDLGMAPNWLGWTISKMAGATTA